MGDSIKNIFTFLIIVIILFLLMYSKSMIEFFKVTNTINDIEINVNLKNNILWKTDYLDNITVLNKGTFLMKNKDLITSNENITRNFKYNGFIFKPNKNLTNIKIGLKNLDNENMSHYYNITQNNTFSIQELTDEETYETQNINFCSTTVLKKCMNKANLYNYNHNDYLGIMIQNDIVHYLIVTKNLNNNDITYSANVIHKSIHTPNYPIKVFIVNEINDNMIDESYWVTNNFIGKPNKWSVNIINMDSYDKEALPPKESLTEKVENKKKNIKEEKYSLEGLAPWDKKIFITDSKFDINTYGLELETITNMTDDNIKYLKEIFINVVFNIDNQERILTIPYKTDKNLNIIKTNLNKYQKYFENIKDFNVYIELVRSKTNMDKNIISNMKKIIV